MKLSDRMHPNNFIGGQASRHTRRTFWSAFGFWNLEAFMAYCSLVFIMTLSLIYYIWTHMVDLDIGESDSSLRNEKASYCPPPGALSEVNWKFHKINEPDDDKALVGAIVGSFPVFLVLFVGFKILRAWLPFIYGEASPEVRPQLPEVKRQESLRNEATSGKEVSRLWGSVAHLQGGTSVASISTRIGTVRYNESQRHFGRTSSRRMTEKSTFLRSNHASFQIPYTECEFRVQDSEADEAIDAAGLDGWMLLRYHTLNCRILTTVGSVVMAILCPLHVCFGTSTDYLSSFGINNIPRESDLLWVHAVLVWFVVIGTGLLITDAHQRFLVYRYGWLSALPMPRASTLLVENIPPEHRSDQGLKRFYSTMLSATAVERAYVLRNSAELKKRFAAWESACYRVRVKQALTEKASWLIARSFTQKLIQRIGARAYEIDALNDVADDVDDFDRQEDEAWRAWLTELKHVEGAVAAEDKSVFASTGFVTFTSRRWAALALDRRYTPDVKEFVMSMPPDPSDVIYPDLALDRAGLLAKEFSGKLFVCLVFVVWVGVAFVVSTIASQRAVQEILPWTKMGIQPSGTIIAGLVLKMFMTIMPNILMIIIKTFFSLKAGTWAQYRLQGWYYGFQVIFVVLAPALGRVGWWTVACFLDNPVGTVQALELMPQASHFYLSYMILGWSGTLVFALRPIVVMRYHIFRAVLGHENALLHAQNEHPAFFGTGVRMAKAVAMMTVALVFCICSPPICVFSLVYFAINRRVFMFLLLHAEVKRPDLGGSYWVRAMEQMFFALLLFVFVMFAILLARAKGRAPAYVALGSLTALYWLWSRFRRFEWLTLPLDQIAKLDHASYQAWGAEYLQPDCDASAASIASQY